MGKNSELQGELQELKKKVETEIVARQHILDDYKALEARYCYLAPLLGTKLSLILILTEVKKERDRQDAKWGIQHHPDGTGTEEYKKMADAARASCDAAFKEGKGTWKHILTEEFMEAMAESDPEKLITELEQTMAVAAAWIEDIRGRASKEAQGQDAKKQ